MKFDATLVVNAIRTSPVVPRKKSYNEKYRVYVSFINILFNSQGYFKEKHTNVATSIWKSKGRSRFIFFDELT